MSLPTNSGAALSTMATLATQSRGPALVRSIWSRQSGMGTGTLGLAFCFSFCRAGAVLCERSRGVRRSCRLLLRPMRPQRQSCHQLTASAHSRVSSRVRWPCASRYRRQGPVRPLRGSMRGTGSATIGVAAGAWSAGPGAEEFEAVRGCAAHPLWPRKSCGIPRIPPKLLGMTSHAPGMGDRPDWTSQPPPARRAPFRLAFQLPTARTMHSVRVMVQAAGRATRLDRRDTPSSSRRSPKSSRPSPRSS